MQVMPPTPASSWIAIKARRREYPLPAPVPGRPGVLAIDRVRQLDASEPAGEVVVMLLAHLLDMLLYRVAQRLGKHGDAILPPLAVPNDDLAPLKLNVLDAQARALEDAEPGPVEQRGHETYAP